MLETISRSFPILDESTKKEQPTNSNNNSICIRTHEEVIKTHNIYFYEFGTSKELTDAFDIINSAAESDKINIRLNNPGGYISSGIQFMNCLNTTENKNVTIYVDAPVYSMGALFATKVLMSSRKVVLGKNVFFMYHDYSGGNKGKGNELIISALHQRQWTEKVFTDFVSPFLTFNEIYNMVKGQDLYLDYDEIVKRYKRIHGRKGSIKHV